MGSKPGQRKIISALYSSHDGFSFTELKKITGLSNPSLSLYLKDLQLQTIIRKDPASSKYKIAESYVPAKKLSEWRKNNASIPIAKMLPMAMFSGRKIREIKDDNLRREAYKLYLDGFWRLLSTSLLTVIHESVSVSMKDKQLWVPRAFQDYLFDFVLPMCNGLYDVEKDFWADRQIANEVKNKIDEETFEAMKKLLDTQIPDKEDETNPTNSVK